VLVNVAVNRTTPPGVTEVTLEVLVMASEDTVTVEEQAGSVLAAAQLLPSEAEVTVLVRILLPVSGLLTVAENVMVAVPWAGTVPVQVRFGLVKVTVPTVAAASPL
jgi:hypothetical protein